MKASTIVRYLMSIDAINRGGLNEFRLTSGHTSDIYCDSRMAALDSNGLILVAEAMSALLLPYEYDCIGTIEGTGSCALLGGLLLYLGETLQDTIVRKAPKEHGLCKMIEGHIGRRPVLIDDVATSGKSLIHAIEHMPVLPQVACVLLNRDEGAAEALKSYNVKLLSVLTMKDIRDIDVSQ